jgi:DNA-binding response OmpR family regulator
LSAFGQCLQMPKPYPLVVVEDTAISTLIRTLLRRESYTVIVTGTANALLLLRQPAGFHGILLTNTPEDFKEFADTVPLLYLSGAPDPRFQQLFRRCRVVSKPFGRAELFAALKQLATS